MKKICVLLTAALLAAAPVWAADHHHAHWSYSGKTGAKHWGAMEEGFKTCAIGKAQSPINIVAKQAEKGGLKPLELAYASSAGEIVNNGHTIQVNLANAGSLTLDGAAYRLLQFHFHSPSEEQINGKHFPLVAHFVHKSEAGQLAVVGVLFKVGKENAALKEVFANLPAKEGDKQALTANLDPAAVLPENRAYYGFMGSLTTPPCSEEVRWHVLKTPVEVSKAQLKAFTKLYKMNARPVQPLHGRKVQVSE